MRERDRRGTDDLILAPSLHAVLPSRTAPQSHPPNLFSNRLQGPPASIGSCWIKDHQLDAEYVIVTTAGLAVTEEGPCIPLDSLIGVCHLRLLLRPMLYVR